MKKKTYTREEVRQLIEAMEYDIAKAEVSTQFGSASGAMFKQAVLEYILETKKMFNPEDYLPKKGK